VNSDGKPVAAVSVDPKTGKQTQLVDLGLSQADVYYFQAWGQTDIRQYIIQYTETQGDPPKSWEGVLNIDNPQGFVWGAPYYAGKLHDSKFGWIGQVENSTGAQCIYQESVGCVADVPAECTSTSCGSSAILDTVNHAYILDCSCYRERTSWTFTFDLAKRKFTYVVGPASLGVSKFYSASPVPGAALVLTASTSAGPGRDFVVQLVDLSDGSIPAQVNFPRGPRYANRPGSITANAPAQLAYVFVYQGEVLHANPSVWTLSMQPGQERILQMVNTTAIERAFYFT